MPVDIDVRPVGTVGAVVSLKTVTFTDADVPMLFAASYALVVNACVPFVSAVVSRLKLYGLLVSVPASEPSTYNSTLVTLKLSDALAVTAAVVPLTVALSAGLVMLVVGTVVSAFATVTVTLLDVVVLPLVSRATAVRVWVPSLTAVVFQLVEYGDAVSSLPKLTPSSLNCTPATAALSEALAVTLVVPLTVAWSAGAVTETVGAVVSGLPLEVT
jgi:vacuolar-type H+-ATPase subunit I/STV1